MSGDGSTAVLAGSGLPLFLSSGHDSIDPKFSVAWDFSLFTTDGAATRTGTIHLYDPYGQNIDPVTGVIGDIPIPATAEGSMDFGWLGQYTIPIEHVASQQALEMGARTYLPILGRFLQVDPISGASANNYDYVNGDPINTLDLTGESPKGGKGSLIAA